MNNELRAIRAQLQEIAEKEATKLFRLAWRMTAHGCDPAEIEKCRVEARELHLMGFPERLLDPFKTWNYAFRF